MEFMKKSRVGLGLQNFHIHTPLVASRCQATRWHSKPGRRWRDWNHGNYIHLEVSDRVTGYKNFKNKK